jgi:hypothetical protein
MRAHPLDLIEPNKILENTAPEDQAKGVARNLAHNCARNQTDAVDKVDEILARYGTTMDLVLNKAQPSQSLAKSCPAPACARLGTQHDER